MYMPQAFEQKDPDLVFGLMSSLGVATAVSNGPEGMIASHVPVEIDREGGAKGIIRCHFAKPNLQPALIAEGAEVLFIFQGPLAYVTPAWYPTKAETGKVVPTLNFAVVHAYGTGRAVEDPIAMRRHLTALTDHFEAEFPEPWKVSDAPDEYIDRMMKGITVVEVSLTRLEGKWKLSQNRSEGDRRGVTEGYRTEGRADMQALMEDFALGGRQG
ncbi:FMN-binding negative transcriptional regulator [Hwanghaeella grinnelliae]|uniref:FMN-binding negative transcriptional regulator n=1 Tax=Hwanghaeella grinnelliae TaxID=2500179 RepID=A0A437QTW2_9PROT|nr:FMN-binding negative transcriptional regulator [Hwanghaeella grinnelliae]RVU37944.1 FMN-binding negative transcriptional regulator [Hwanghaeella grinnelliae]